MVTNRLWLRQQFMPMTIVAYRVISTHQNYYEWVSLRIRRWTVPQRGPCIQRSRVHWSAAQLTGRGASQAAPPPPSVHACQKNRARILV